MWYFYTQIQAHLAKRLRPLLFRNDFISCLSGSQYTMRSALSHVRTDFKYKAVTTFYKEKVKTNEVRCTLYSDERSDVL